MQLPRENRPFRLALVASCAALLMAATPVVAQQVTGAGVPAEADVGVQVMSWPGSADHAASILAAALRTAGTTSAAPLPAADAGALADANTPLPGPRVRPEVWGVEPRLADHRDSALAAVAGGKNTIVLSTLAIVLIAVIITILVVD